MGGITATPNEAEYDRLFIKLKSDIIDDYTFALSDVLYIKGIAGETPILPDLRLAGLKNAVILLGKSLFVVCARPKKETLVLENPKAMLSPTCRPYAHRGVRNSNNVKT